jgi:hypothetical protein
VPSLAVQQRQIESGGHEIGPECIDDLDLAKLPTATFSPTWTTPSISGASRWSGPHRSVDEHRHGRADERVATVGR